MDDMEDNANSKEELIIPELLPTHIDHSISIKTEPYELMESDGSETTFPFRCFVCNVDTASQQELFEHYEACHTELNEESSQLGNEHEMKIEDNNLVGDEAPNNILNDGKDQQIEEAFGESEVTSGHEWLFNCTVCGFASTEKLDVLNHMEEHIEAQPMQCKDCMYIFSNQYYLKDYASKGLFDKPHVCRHCPFRSHSLQKLKDHCFYNHHFEKTEPEPVVPVEPIPAPIVPTNKSVCVQSSMPPSSVPISDFQGVVSSNSSVSYFNSPSAVDKKADKPTSSSLTGSFTQEQKNEYYLVLKDCQSNGQSLGDLKIPAHYILPHVFSTASPKSVSGEPQSLSTGNHTNFASGVQVAEQPAAHQPQHKYIPSELIESNSSSSDSFSHNSPENSAIPQQPSQSVDYANDKKNLGRRSRCIPCPVCPHLARDTWNLKTHMLTHTKEKPFACKLCSYRASQAAHVRKHMIVHTKGGGRRKYR